MVWARGGVVAAWLKDPSFDVLFIVGVTALAGAMSGATVLAPALFVPIVTVHIWLFGYDHVVSTFTRLVGRQQDRRRHRFLIWGLPPLVLAAVFAVAEGIGFWVLTSTYFFWQAFHCVRQSWGIAQRYRVQAGGMPWDDARLSEITLWSVPVWGLLRRCQGQPAQLLYQELWTPAVPGWLVSAAGLVSIALLARFAVQRARAFGRGELPLGHTLFVLTHFLIFAVGYGVLKDINSGWLLINVWHNVQYLLYVWLTNRERFAGGVTAEAPRLSWLCQPGAGRAVAYALSCVGVATAIFWVLLRGAEGVDRWLDGSAVSVALVIALTLNFHHYLVDGVIWKRRSKGPVIRPAAAASASRAAA